MLTLLLACTRPEPADPPASPSTPDDETGTEPPDTVPEPTGDTGSTAPAPFDCAAVPTGLRPTVALEGLYPSEDFAFDREGHLISATGTELVKQAYPPGAVVPFASTGTDPSSLRMLATGDLVYANIDSSTLFRVTMDGVREPVASGFGYATGIDVHPSGLVFMGDVDRVKRIDPYTGTVDLAVRGEVAGIPGIINGLSFSADYRTLFLGTRDALYRVPVDETGRADGPAEIVWEADFPGELLGLGVDACDNVYGLYSGRLFRVRPDGTGGEVLMEGGLTTTNLQWGSGIGGWDDHTIYVVDRNPGRPPYTAVDVGVPSKPY